MSNKPRRWPDYALSAWEDTVYHLKCIDNMAREIQDAAIKAGHYDFAKATNDIRVRAIDAKSRLHQARNGEYE